MSGRPGVSVIVPVFNLKDCLDAAVASALGQTFRDFEIILVDDGSTDGSRERIARYREEYPGSIRAILLEHGGAPAARNAGIAAARGEWIAFLDGDDAWKPEKLEAQMRLAAEDPRCNFIACAAEILGQGGWFHPLPSQPIDLRLELLRRGCFLTLSTVMIRRELLAGAGFDERLEGAQDIDLFLRLADAARLGLILQPLVMYRRRENAISGMQGSRYLQAHRHYQIVRRELERLGREDPSRLRPHRAEIQAAARRLAHEAAYYALMNPRATLAARMKFAAIAIGEQPQRLKNYRLLLQALLPAGLNRRLSGARRRRGESAAGR